jgi:hypothetical protein
MSCIIAWFGLESATRLTNNRDASAHSISNGLLAKAFGV